MPLPRGQLYPYGYCKREVVVGNDFSILEGTDEMLIEEKIEG
jgi:hypothetical protein